MWNLGVMFKRLTVLYQLSRDATVTNKNTS